MKELGEYLKETRENHGVSPKEAANDLDISLSELESMEQGNVRAFRDVYALKSMVKDYAKYLGLDPVKVLDEFNDFLFEHTSKISLEDILEAKNKKQETKREVQSPYTIIKQKKVNFAPIVLAITVCFLVLLVLYLLLRTVPRDDGISSELRGVVGGEYFELT